MSTDHDFDQIARAWLDLMPGEVPDRVLAAVREEIDHIPQVRRPHLAGSWRFPQMTRRAVVGAVCAMVAIAIAAVALSPRSTLDAGHASASSGSLPPDTVSPSAVGPGGPIGPELQHRWMGAHSSLVDARAGTSLSISDTTFALSQANVIDHPILVADVTQTGPGQLRLTTRDSGGPCAATAIGSYTWRLSDSGRVLNVVSADDPCTERSDALLGTWWLMGCKAADDNCLGPLDAATYSSQSLNLQQHGSAWQPEFGALTYSVPTGWANDADWPDRFGLTPQAAYESWTPEGGTSSGISVRLAVAAPMKDAKPCSGQAAGGGRDRGSIVAAMQAIPGLVVGAPSSITLDGRPGTVVDLAVDDATLRPCNGGARVVEFLVGSSGGQTLASGSRARLILLEDASGTIAITLAAPASEFAGLVSSGMRIVESMQVR
jgi:hypothetical protein